MSGGIDTTLIKKPENYGVYGTVLGRSLLPSEVHGNFDVLIGVINSMLGALTPASFGARYGNPTKQWVPVGTPYRQLPGQKAPTEIYQGTWEYYGQAGSTLSSRAGRFSRAEGGNALGFGAGQQNMMFEDHIHGVYYRGGGDAGSGTGTDSWGGAISHQNIVYGAQSGSRGNETRPVNDTERDWVCVNAPA